MTGDGKRGTDEQYWIVQGWKLVVLIINVEYKNPSLEGFLYYLDLYRKHPNDIRFRAPQLSP